VNTQLGGDTVARRTLEWERLCRVAWWEPPSSVRDAIHNTRYHHNHRGIHSTTIASWWWCFTRTYSKLGR